MAGSTLRSHPEATSFLLLCRKTNDEPDFAGSQRIGGMMNRRSFVKLAVRTAMSFPTTHPLAFGQEKSKLKITGVRIVTTRPKRPVPEYKPAAGAWSTGG